MLPNHTAMFVFDAARCGWVTGLYMVGSGVHQPIYPCLYVRSVMVEMLMSMCLFYTFGFIALFFINLRVHFRAGQNFWGKFLISSILKNWLVEIEALGPNLYVSAIKALLRVVQGPHITMTKLVDFCCPQLYYLFMHHTSMHFQIFDTTHMAQHVRKTFASMQKQIPLYLQHSRWTMLHLQIFSCRKAHIHAHYGKYPQNLYRLMNINSFAFPAFQMHWYASQNTVEPLLSHTSENP